MEWKNELNWFEFVNEARATKDFALKLCRHDLVRWQKTETWKTGGHHLKKTRSSNKGVLLLLSTFEGKEKENHISFHFKIVIIPNHWNSFELSIMPSLQKQRSGQPSWGSGMTSGMIPRGCDSPGAQTFVKNQHRGVDSTSPWQSNYCSTRDDLIWSKSTPKSFTNPLNPCFETRFHQEL